MPDEELAKLLKRGQSGVRTHRCELGIPAAPRIEPERWPPAKVALLGTAPDQEIARRLGISTGTVSKRRAALGIPKWDQKLKPWKPVEDALLGKMPDTEVSKRTGRSFQAVGSRRRDLKIPKFGMAIRHWTRAEDGLLGTIPDKQFVGNSREAVTLLLLAGRRKASRPVGVDPGAHTMMQFWAPVPTSRSPCC